MAALATAPAHSRTLRVRSFACSPAALPSTAGSSAPLIALAIRAATGMSAPLIALAIGSDRP